MKKMLLGGMLLLSATTLVACSSSSTEKTTKKSDNTTQTSKKGLELSFDDSYTFRKVDGDEWDDELDGLKVTVKQPYFKPNAYSEAGYDSYDEFIDYYPEFKGNNILVVPIKLKNTTSHYIDTPSCIVVGTDNSPLEYSYIDGVSEEIDGLEAGEEAETVDVYVATDFNPVSVAYGNKLWK